MSTLSTMPDKKSVGWITNFGNNELAAYRTAIMAYPELRLEIRNEAFDTNEHLIPGMFALGSIDGSTVWKGNPSMPKFWEIVDKLSPIKSRCY